jgi:preprotein translocase subunit SecD
VLLTATNIVNVSPSQDDRGMPAVGITLDREGQNIFSRKTAENVGEILAITLDGKVISAPRIETAINQPRFIIQGQFTQKQVSDMVVKIKSGSLPARVRILEERVIGPTLGRDAIAEGVRASAIGLAFVGLFMIYWFRRAGVYSVIALTLNMLFMAGMLSGMDAVLTLPGIAGFILTIGMAVDANVLVYERIKEEVNRGVTLTNAITRGFDSAYVTILDANITTFIAAFCLLLMGEGPVKGFAVMLMIGIISSIFTAVYCTRTFFMAVDLPNHSLSIFPLHRNQGAQRSHS